MPGLEFLAEVMSKEKIPDFGKIVDSGLIIGGAFCLGLLIYYVPKWREYWIKQDELREAREKEKQEALDEYLHVNGH